MNCGSFNFDFMNDNEMEETIKWVTLARKIRHKTVLFIKDVILSDSSLHLISPSTKYGSADKVLPRCGVVNEQVIAHMAHQVCEALIYLHYNLRIVHRGVCPSSLFIDGKCVILLGGLNNITQMPPERYKCTDYPTKYTSLMSWYSPELLEQDYYGYGYNSDVYSLGLMVMSIFTGHIPYNDCEPALIFMKKIHLVEFPSLDVSADRLPASELFRDFYKICTLHNPRERPSSVEIVSHPWLQTGRQCNNALWKKTMGG